jgi:ATP-binding cassette subfamily C protein CydC
MRALIAVARQSRAQGSYLLSGLLMTTTGTLVGMALSGSAGAVLAGTGTMVAAPLLLRALGPTRVVMRYFERLITHDALFRAQADLRVWFFRGLAGRMAGGLGMQRAGDVLARLVGDVEAQDAVYMRIMLPLAAAAAMLPLLMILLWRESAGLALCVGAQLVLAALILPGLAARASLASGRRLADAMAGLRISALDALSGLREVRAFGAEGRMLEDVRVHEAELIAAQRDVARSGAIAAAGAAICAQTAILAALVAGRGLGAVAVALVFLVIAAFDAVSLLPRAGVQAGQAAAAAKRVIDAASGPIPLPDPAVPAPLPDASGLRIEGVRFRWLADRALVFDGLTLDIPAGSRVAILGPSGAGKSSLAALALRLAAPEQGCVCLGGVDIASLAATDLRRRIGWLHQATYLFDDSIRANLLLARPAATDAELWVALEQARIADVVRELPDGLDARVGEGGRRFSGGQGRRLALARALLSDARILILDEPCAGLDAEIEQQFLATLNDAADGRTIILIAHRLTGVERLDRIYRLAGGRAVAAAG